MAGSYTGVNPRGLFTLMAPPAGSAPDRFPFPELVNGVIAGVPSSVVNQAPGPDASRPAWTLRGRPLPAVSPSEFGRPNRRGRPGRSSPSSGSAARS